MTPGPHRRTPEQESPSWLDRIRGGRRTLRVRLALPFILLTTVVSLLLVLLLGWQLEQRYTDQARETLMRQVGIAALTFSESETDGDVPELQRLVGSIADRADARVTVIDAEGGVLADSDVDAGDMVSHEDRPEVVEARGSGAGDDRRRSDTTGEWYLYSAVEVPDADGTLIRMARPLTEIESAVGRVQLASLGVVAVLIVSLTSIAWLMSGRIARPLDELRVQANRVSRGDFTVQLNPSSVKEIDEVGSAFGVMTRTLERSLARQEQARTRLNAVMEGLADGVVLTDSDGVVVRMNLAAEEMLDVDETASLGLPFVQVVRDHELTQKMKAVLDDGEQGSATVVYGIEQRSILMTARIVEGARERLGLAVLRDITELRRLESVRREFVANVSHELRTPLTSIRMLVETLEAGVIEEPEVAQDFLLRIVGEVDRLNALVEDLLDFARLEAGRAPLRLERIAAGDAIRAGAGRLEPQVERARLTLAFDVEDDLPLIQLDVKRVEQVLLNLVHNAIKFTPPGGNITVCARQREKDILVTVQDTGVGIPEDEVPRLFERFYKSDKARQSEGTGLGLAIAKHIVHLHGGTIWAESVQGEGASFNFTLPIKGKKARRRARRQSAGLL